MELLKYFVDVKSRYTTYTWELNKYLPSLPTPEPSQVTTMGLYQKQKRGKLRGVLGGVRCKQ